MDASARSECLPGTRTDLLLDLVGWTSNPWIEQRIVWLYGLAGSGKSTFSTSFANFYRRHGRLGAFIFFDRDVEERNQPSNVIRTLAYQLGSFDVRIGTAIAAAIEATPSLPQSPLPLQFVKLLIEPLSSLPASEPPIILVLDALDECGNAGDRATLLNLLAAESTYLPPFIRVLITSRAEFDIRTAYATQSHVLLQELELSSDNNVKDILSFLHSRMSEIRSANTSLSLARDWPGEAAIYALGQRAAGLFVWASTACRFIEGHDPRKRLGVLLRGDIYTNAEAALDALYTTALNSVGRWDDEDFCSDFRAIMGMILVARNPLSDNAIDILLALDRPSRHTISRLGCVLRWEEMEPVRILHPSFADFLSTYLRCRYDIWHVDTDLHNHLLATHCIKHLHGMLRSNICNLVLSREPATGVIPEALSYASMSWIDHVLLITEKAESFADTLEHFIFRHLLHWLEVMSILEKSRTTITSVRCLLDWLRVWHSNLFLVQL
jgi:hypothetical protein